MMCTSIVCRTDNTESKQKSENIAGRDNALEHRVGIRITVSLTF